MGQNRGISNSLLDDAKRFGKYGNYETALELCGKAINEDAGNVTAYQFQAFCYKKLGQFQNEITALESALTLKDLTPKQLSVIYNNLGVAHYALKHHDKAIEAYNKCLEQTPDCAHVKINLALVYIKTKQLAEATKFYKEVFEENDLSGEGLLASYASLQDAMHQHTNGGVKYLGDTCQSLESGLIGNDLQYLTEVEC